MHPSSSAVAYVVSGPDADSDALAYQLFVLDEPGGEARLLSKSARRPRWSPSGDRIAFLLRSGHRWIAACQNASGGSVHLASPPGDVVDLEWAPDGERLLAVTSETSAAPTDGRPRHVSSARDWLVEPSRRAWVLSLSGDLHPAVDGWSQDDLWGARWAPDGHRVAFTSDSGVPRETSSASGLWLADPTLGEIEELVAPKTPIRALAWAPDGNAIAYLAQSRDNAASAHSQLWVLNVATRSLRRLAPALDRSIGLAVRGDDERAVGPPLLAWTPDSASVLAIYAEGGRSRLARFGLDGRWEDVVADERCILEFSLGGSVAAFSWSDPVTPGEISAIDLTTGSGRSVTRLQQSVIAGIDLAPTRRLAVVADDGVEVEGWLTSHDDTLAGAPLVLQVHGGPHYPVGERFSFDAQRLAALGMGVLRANPRGSQGYGQAFADGNLGDWGGRDLEDLLALVDEALRTGHFDPNRVAIVGESYGGYMAAWAVASSERFAAAVAESAVADFISAAGGVVGPTFWYSELGGSPWEKPEGYLERSPITRMNRVRVPVLVLHCEADLTCPIAHGEALYTALRTLGQCVEFLRVPDEGHFFNLFGALSRRLERTRVLDDFLVRHLQLGESDPAREETHA